jgi:FSR family fosmidomycin resistance protein-like MFS transporter
VILAGGTAFVGALLLVASAGSFAWLLLAFGALGTASGAFVSLSQAGLMDLEPERRERNMARWVLAGSIGVVAGPLLLGAVAATGRGWRPAFAILALLAVPSVVAATRIPPSAGVEGGIAEAIRGAARAARRSEVLRWLVVLELTDLMGDVFLGFVALYLVDVAGTSVATGALAVALLGASGLAGDAILLVVLRRTSGGAWLRASAIVAIPTYAAFLTIAWVPGKLMLLAVLGVLHAGWYAIPKARLFDDLHGSSGAAVALSNVGGLVGASIPLVLGVLAARAGLGPVMWILMIAPLALIATFRPPRPRAGDLS